MSYKNILVTGGAGFVGANLTLELQDLFPDAWITVIDDFRCANFKNLQSFRGDVVAADVSSLNWADQFGRCDWDVVFHLASVTDTTDHNQMRQVHDNVEGFRKLMEFVQPSGIPVVYASSAATYGIAAGVNKETQDPAPANVYAFSKMVLDNLARHYRELYPNWKIVGLKYFNVYGPREAHKGVPASMIYHLAQQIRDGKRPRIFKMGEQMRDFVYVKDVVRMTIAAVEAEESGIYNVGTGTPRSFNDVVAALNTVLETEFEPEYIENPYPFYQPHTEADMSKTHSKIGVKAEFSLEDGVKDYFESGFLIEK